MDAFVTRKRRRVPHPHVGLTAASPTTPSLDCSGEDSTDIKIAILLSQFPDIKQEDLLDVLVSCEGFVDAAVSLLSSQASASGTASKKRAFLSSARGAQTSLSSHVLTKAKDGSIIPLENSPAHRKPLATKKGQTLHLYSPEDIAAHTPCTIIHNFLPSEQANALLIELLDESKHFIRYEFQLFNRTVQSPHTGSLYVSTPEEYQQHLFDYKHGGTYRSNIRQATPELRSVSNKVQCTVNDAIQARIRDFYPDGKKLKYQSPKEWRPNAAFVNCYDGPTENVGYHSDELTYLGPHPVIGSLSLGVEREFRIRRVLPREEDDAGQSISSSNGPNGQSSSNARADAQGQISIHLPHNSLLIMHAEMQEEWKHSIAPAQTISPHPISGNRRINVTYRWYRDTLHPRYTPRCLCGEQAILRCAQRKRETRGRYMWMCYAGYAPGKESCSFFQWAEFDDDGDPIWAHKRPEEGKVPVLPNFSAPP